MSGSSNSRRGWRYFATRLNGDGTETMIHPDLPIESVTIEDTLSGDNAISGEIDPVFANTIGSDGQPILREWSTAIYAEADGSIRAGAIMNHGEINGSKLSIEAVGFTGYGRDMPYTGSGYLGVQVDPLDMFRLVWAHIQGQPGGNIGLTFASTQSPVRVGTPLTNVTFTPSTTGQPVTFEAGPYKLAWYVTHDLQGKLDDDAASTPFDYHEIHSWNSDGTIKHFVDLGYPRIGRRRDDLRFQYGVNIYTPFDIERDGAMYASGTMVLGSGDGASMVKAIVEPPTRPNNRLRRIAIVTDNTIKTTSAATKRAAVENQWRAQLDDISSVVVVDHPHAPLGAVSVGDEIRLEGQGDWTTTDMWVRVLKISYQPENGKTAQYTVARTDKLTS